LCCLFFFDIRILITPLVSFCHCVVFFSSIYGFWLPLWYLQTLLTFGHCVVCSSSIYGFWLPLWYLQTLLTFGHCVVCFLRYTDSDYPFGIFKLFLLLAIVLSVLLRYTDSDYPFRYLLAPLIRRDYCTWLINANAKPPPKSTITPHGNFFSTVFHVNNGCIGSVVK
jgi:hypothetical protein